MSPTCLVMTKRKDTPHFIVGNTPPKNLVRAVLKQIRIIPNKELNEVEEPISVILSLTLRDPTSNETIRNVRVDSIQLLIEKALRNTRLTLLVIENPRQMVSYKVLRTFLILNFTVKLLQKQDPSHKFRFSILLRKMVLKSKVVSIENHIRLNEISSKLLKAKNHNPEFFLSNNVVQLGIIQSVTSIVNNIGLLINTLS